MTFSDFVTDLYSGVLNRHSNSLSDLKAATVRTLQELSARRVLFNEGSVELTLPTRAPYGGEWVGPGLDGFPLDILEVDGVYYRSSASSGWCEVPGPVPIGEIRSYEPPLRVAETPLSIYPLAWAWWDNKLWFPRVSGDVTLKIDFYRDGTRDRATGVPITASSTEETNGWFDRGLQALRSGVLADYYLLAASRDEAQASIEMGKRNVFLDTLSVERRMREGSSFQAPVY